MTSHGSSVTGDEYWMQRALELAEQAAREGEVPVGAVVVRDGEALGLGRNRPIAAHDPSAHAEVEALRAAASRAGNYRLPGATLYVTIEPCVMCAGAIIHARIARVVFGAVDPKAGAAGGALNVLTAGVLNHRPECEGGVCAEQAGALLREFFQARRGARGAGGLRSHAAGAKMRTPDHRGGSMDEDKVEAVQDLAARVGEALKERALMLATAESCTGGWVAQAITSVAGSSAWFERGFVTYSNRAKQEMLGVAARTLEAHGAVSEEVVREMARGALAHSAAQVSVAITGIAGPEGGTSEKPVGMVWLAWAAADGTIDCRVRQYAGDRGRIRQQAVMDGLHGILDIVAEQHESGSPVSG